MFENVNYDYYSNILGRAVVPDVETFEKFKFENETYIKSLIEDGLIEARNETSFDSLVCMAIEEDYKAFLIENDTEDFIISESVNGYSYSKDTKQRDKLLELNAKSTAERKYKWLTAFCYVKGWW